MLRLSTSPRWSPDGATNAACQPRSRNLRQTFASCATATSDDGRLFVVEGRREERTDGRTRLTQVPVQEDTRIAAGGIRVVSVLYVLQKRRHAKSEGCAGRWEVGLINREVGGWPPEQAGDGRLFAKTYGRWEVETPAAPPEGWDALTRRTAG